MSVREFSFRHRDAFLSSGNPLLAVLIDGNKSLLSGSKFLFRFFLNGGKFAFSHEYPVLCGRKFLFKFLALVT